MLPREGGPGYHRFIGGKEDLSPMIAGGCDKDGRTFQATRDKGVILGAVQELVSCTGSSTIELDIKFEAILE